MDIYRIRGFGRWGGGLVCTAMLILAGFSAQAGPQATSSPYDIFVDKAGGGLTFTTNAPLEALLFLKVRVATPDGRTAFEQVSRDGFATWTPGAKAIDGSYDYEARVVTVTPGAPTLESAPGANRDGFEEKGTSTATGPATVYYADRYKQIGTVSGSAVMRGGILKLRDRVPGHEEARHQPAPAGFPERVAGALLEWMVPAAAAQDLVVSDDTPDLRFNDTDSSATEWRIRAGDGVGSDLTGADTGDFDIYEGNGDTQRLTIEQVTGDVGIGTQTPSGDLHIVGTLPKILLEDTGEAETWHITNSNANRYEVHANVNYPHGGDSSCDPQNCSSIPFTIEAPTTDTQASQQDQAIYVASNGNIGLGDDNPILGLSISKPIAGINFNDSDNGGSSQIAYNPTTEAIQIGSLFDPGFRVSHFADSGSLSVASDNNVGVGTNAPGAALHVRRSNGTAGVLVQETSGTAAARELFKLSNNGGPFFIFENTDIGQSYSFAMGATGHFILSHQQTSGVQMRLTPAGNLTISGSLSEGSSRTIKDDITPLDGETVLAKLESLPVSEWSYTADRTQRHAGPMAEDFYAAFGLGPDNKHITPRDLAGVALAAAKALKTENDALKAKVSKIDAIEARLKELESRESL